MAHLKKDANGHLWKNTAGHLVNECPERVPLVPSGPCQGCRITYTLTVSGGNPAELCDGDNNCYCDCLNGVYTLTWNAGCEWLGTWDCGGGAGNCAGTFIINMSHTPAVGTTVFMPSVAAACGTLQRAVPQACPALGAYTQIAGNCTGISGVLS